MEQTVTADLFESLDLIRGLGSGGQWLEAVGFDKHGNLVHCDGQGLKLITLKESVAHLSRLTELLEENEDLNDGGHYNLTAHSLWLKMLAATLK